jgi:enolase
MRVDAVRAAEMLDSRGRPTVAVQLTVGGATFDAGVPSGASTGTREAVERRDGDPTRYGGSGVLSAVAAVTEAIAELVVGQDWSTLADLDGAMCAADATADKSRLGANAIVGVSMAAARAFAAESDQPLYRYLTPGGSSPRLPVPHFNVLNGGAHAPNPLEFQEFMIAPLGAPNVVEAIRAGAEIYAALRRRLSAEGYATGLGDEGGFAPDLTSPAKACELLTRAVDDAGYRLGADGAMLALDPAGNGFYDDGGYLLNDETLSPEELVELYAELVERFPIWSIEDGCAETDVAGWRALTHRLGDHVQLVGDDLFVTNAETITDAARRGVANAALIKVNQVGTVTETLAALEACRRCGFSAMVSHRSGETTDAFIADLAVGSGCGQLKSGAPARGERVSKYNRLMEISRADVSLPYGLPDGVRLSG